MGQSAACTSVSAVSAREPRGSVVQRRGFRKTDALLGPRPPEAALRELPAGEARSVPEPSTAALLTVLAGSVILAAIVISLSKPPPNHAAAASTTYDDNAHRLCIRDGLLQRCDDDFF